MQFQHASRQVSEQSGGCYQRSSNEAIKYIIGKGDLLTGRLRTYDALKMEFHTIKLPKDHNCAICGDNPTIHELIDYEQAECDMHK